MNKSFQFNISISIYCYFCTVQDKKKTFIIMIIIIIILEKNYPEKVSCKSTIQMQNLQSNKLIWF